MFLLVIPAEVDQDRASVAAEGAPAPDAAPVPAEGVAALPRGSAVLLHTARLQPGAHRAGVAHPRRHEGLGDRALRAVRQPDAVITVTAQDVVVAAHFDEVGGEVRLLRGQGPALERWTGMRLYRQDLQAQSVENERRLHRHQMRGALMRGDLGAAERHRREGKISGWW